MPDYLRREDAGFPAGLWKELDSAALEAARQQLVGRRMLPLDGPFGIGLKLVTRRAEEQTAGGGQAGAGVAVGGGLAVPLLYQEFEIGVRDVEAHAAFGQPLDPTPVMRAATAVAVAEDRIVFHGEPKAGVVGLTNAPGVSSTTVGDWARGEQAIEDLIRAVTMVDQRGPRGPYALALAPDLYNALFHKYQESDLLRIQHLQSLATGGIHKSLTLMPRTGVLLVATREVARLVLGQDLAIAYRDLVGVFHQFVVLESLVVEVLRPEGVCVLKPAEAGGQP